MAICRVHRFLDEDSTTKMTSRNVPNPVTRSKRKAHVFLSLIFAYNFVSTIAFKKSSPRYTQNLMTIWKKMLAIYSEINLWVEKLITLIWNTTLPWKSDENHFISRRSADTNIHSYFAIRSNRSAIFDLYELNREGRVFNRTSKASAICPTSSMVQR